MTKARPDRVMGTRSRHEFWEWCDFRELRLQRCVACNQLAWPIVEKCENCQSCNFSWEKVSGRGTVVAWATFHNDYYDGKLQLPWATILVELDEGPLIISNPLEFNPDVSAVGQPVYLDFQDSQDSHGSFRLPVFRLCRPNPNDIAIC